MHYLCTKNDTMGLTFEEYKNIIIRFLKEKKLLNEVIQEVKNYCNEVKCPYYTDFDDLFHFVYRHGGNNFFNRALVWNNTKRGFGFYQDLDYELDCLLGKIESTKKYTKDYQTTLRVENFWTECYKEFDDLLEKLENDTN